MPRFSQIKIPVCRLVAVLVLLLSVSVVTHAIEIGDGPHDDRHCPICSSLHYSSAGLISASVEVPRPPVETCQADLLEQQVQRSPDIFRLGARAPPLS